MTYESDQQLTTLGLKRLEDLPRKDGFKCTAVTRDGREVRFQRYGEDGHVLHHAAYEDLIGWK